MGRIPSILGSGAIRRAPRRDSSRLKGFIEDVASGIKQSVQLGDFLHPIQFFSQRFDGPSSLPPAGYARNLASERRKSPKSIRRRQFGIKKFISETPSLI
jgi:hypothetical protein